MYQLPKKIKLETDKISPRILTCFTNRHQNYVQGYKLSHRPVYDYELEYIIDSTGSMIIDGIEYRLNPGDVIFKRPGQYSQGIMKYSCFFISFDMANDTNKQRETYQFMGNQSFQTYYSNPLLDVIPTVFHPSHPDKYRIIFENIFNQYIISSEVSQVIIRSQILYIITSIYTDIKNPNKKLYESPYGKKIRRVIDYIQNNLDADLSLGKLARICEFSPAHFHKVFKSVVHCTPNEFIINVRLNRAKELIVKSDMPISEIAYKIGYKDIHYFCALFKKYTGTTPGRYRKKHLYN